MMAPIAGHLRKRIDAGEVRAGVAYEAAAHAGAAFRIMPSEKLADS